MHRLFVALRPPSDIRELLFDAMDGVEGAQWQDDEQLHLTLRYIGKVERQVAEDVAIALETVRSPPLTLAIDGVGTFEDRGRSDALWAGVTPREGVTALHPQDRRRTGPHRPAAGGACLSSAHHARASGQKRRPR